MTPVAPLRTSLCVAGTEHLAGGSRGRRVLAVAYGTSLDSSVGIIVVSNKMRDTGVGWDLE